MAEAKKIESLELKIKRKSQRLVVNYSGSEVGPKIGNQHQFWTPRFRKDSDQRLSRALDNIFVSLQPHLLYANELAGSEIKLGEDLDEAKFFNQFEFQEIEMFQGLQITKVQFIGNEAIDAVKIWGYRETQLTEKPFKVKLETPVIRLDRNTENHYKLVHVLIDQIDDLETCVQNWLTGESSDVPLVDESSQNQD